jgi:hypothetical protein
VEILLWIYIDPRTCCDNSCCVWLSIKRSQSFRSLHPWFAIQRLFSGEQCCGYHLQTLSKEIQDWYWCHHRMQINEYRRTCFPPKYLYDPRSGPHWSSWGWVSLSKSHVVIRGGCPHHRTFLPLQTILTMFYTATRGKTTDLRGHHFEDGGKWSPLSKGTLQVFFSISSY